MKKLNKKLTKRERWFPIWSVECKFKRNVKNIIFGIQIESCKQSSLFYSIYMSLAHKIQKSSHKEKLKEKKS